MNIHCLRQKLRFPIITSFKIDHFLFLAWVEGTAILIAVALVAGVGSFVDWRKEIAFVEVKIKQMEKNVVSFILSIRAPSEKLKDS
jgi:hypothetical protein